MVCRVGPGGAFPPGFDDGTDAGAGSGTGAAPTVETSEVTRWAEAPGATVPWHSIRPARFR